MGNPEKKYEMSSRDNISVLMEVSHWSNIPVIQEIKRWCSELLLIKQFRLEEKIIPNWYVYTILHVKHFFANVQLKYVFFKFSGMWDFSLVVYIYFIKQNKSDLEILSTWHWPKL